MIKTIELPTIDNIRDNFKEPARKDNFVILFDFKSFASQLTNNSKKEETGETIHNIIEALPLFSKGKNMLPVINYNLEGEEVRYYTQELDLIGITFKRPMRMSPPKNITINYQDTDDQIIRRFHEYWGSIQGMFTATPVRDGVSLPIEIFHTDGSRVHPVVRLAMNIMYPTNVPTYSGDYNTQLQEALSYTYPIRSFVREHKSLSELSSLKVGKDVILDIED